MGRWQEKGKKKGKTYRVLDQEPLQGSLRCSNGIIASVRLLREIRILGHWIVWGKLVCKNGLDGLDGSDRLNSTRSGWRE